MSERMYGPGAMLNIKYGILEFDSTGIKVPTRVTRTFDGKEVVVNIPYRLVDMKEVGFNPVLKGDRYLSTPEKATVDDVKFDPKYRGWEPPELLLDDRMGHLLNKKIVYYEESDLREYINTHFMEPLERMRGELVSMSKKIYMPTPKRIHKMLSGITVIIWNDGTKTFVKKSKNDKDDPYAAIGQAFLKKIYGSTSTAKRELNKLWHKEQPKIPKKKTDGEHPEVSKKEKRKVDYFK